MPPAAPVAPCGGAQPDFPVLGAAPDIQVFYGADIDWQPAPCTGWRTIPFNVLIATAARFRHDGDIGALLDRMGAVSGLGAVEYWSHTRGNWRTLIVEARALNSSNPADTRGNFEPDELVPDAALYYWQIENTPAGELVYRLSVPERTPDRAVIAIENTEPLRYLFVTVFRAGEYQFLYFFEREQGDVWRYYSLIRIGAGFNPIVRQGQLSYINRAAAMFRHFAGLPTDLEPPAAP